jgi:hypothetical protein
MTIEAPITTDSSKLRRKRGVSRVHTTMALGDDHAVQLVELGSGIQAIVETGLAVEHTPATRMEADPPPDAGVTRVGERPYESGSMAVRDTGEQIWFKNNFCNGSQECVQGWDWAVCGTRFAVGSATGIAMVGREGSRNATFTVYVWECVCVGPFCVGGHECFWVENWRGLVLPGHWLSVDTRAPDHKWLRWNLDGAGGDTQVSLAAKYR